MGQNRSGLQRKRVSFYCYVIDLPKNEIVKISFFCFSTFCRKHFFHMKNASRNPHWYIVCCRDFNCIRISMSRGPMINVAWPSRHDNNNKNKLTDSFSSKKLFVAKIQKRISACPINLFRIQIFSLETKMRFQIKT